MRGRRMLEASFSRKSALYTCATPLYLKRSHVVIYSADKVIYAINCDSHQLLYKIFVHGDIITKLWIQSDKLFSCGLDGKIVISNIEDGRVLSKIVVHKPISRLAHNQEIFVSLLEQGKSNCLSVFNASFQKGSQIFADTETGSLFDVNSYFVAAISGVRLLLHWFKFDKYICYDFPVDARSAAKEYKELTCVACHPTEAIVATGNSLGEIMIWWNFTTKQFPFDEFSLTDIENDVGCDDDDEIDLEHLKCINESSDSIWELRHPCRVKRSGMHWHTSNVTALAFSSNGKHLYSGGVEGVLVKWDLTECFGGVKNRQFLSMLNSPIQEISPPGGLADDCIVVLLERNCFLVVNGAMQIVYKHMGLDQTPWRWRSHSSFHPSIPIALPLVSSGVDNAEASIPILLSGALGGLQVVDAVSAKVLSSMDVNQRHYVNSDMVPTPMVSEALLATVWRDGEWLAIYTELQLPRLSKPRPHLAGYSLDNQAQLVWWRCGSRNPAVHISESQHKFEYEAVFGESLAYLNSQASDLKFARHPDGPLGFQTLLILRDQRLLVWQYNPVSECQSSQRPWKMTACIALNPNMVLFSQPRLLDSPTKLIVLNADEEIRRDLPKSREEALLNSIAAPRSFVVCAFGTYLKSFAWIRWQSGCSLMEDMLPLDTFQLSGIPDWRSSLTSTSAEVCHLGEIKDSTEGRFCAVLLLPPFSVASKRRDDDGALCLLTIDSSGHLSHHTAIFDFAPTGAFAIHPSCGLIAVGLMSGSCMVYNNKLEAVATLAQLPLLPFCDRKRRNRGNKKSKNGCDKALTLPDSLIFLTSASLTSVQELPPLAAIISTRWGREAGRRDLAVYGADTLKPLKAPVAQLSTKSTKVTFRAEQEVGGLLAQAERVEDNDVVDKDEEAAGEELLLPEHRRKRRLVTDTEVVRTLRLISQFPVDTAPPPEQLLAQLFKKPSI